MTRREKIYKLVFLCTINVKYHTHVSYYAYKNIIKNIIVPEYNDKKHMIFTCVFKNFSLTYHIYISLLIIYILHICMNVKFSSTRPTSRVNLPPLGCEF